MQEPGQTIGWFEGSGDFQPFEISNQNHITFSRAGPSSQTKDAGPFGDFIRSLRLVLMGSRHLEEPIQFDSYRLGLNSIHAYSAGRVLAGRVLR